MTGASDRRLAAAAAALVGALLLAACTAQPDVAASNTPTRIPTPTPTAAAACIVGSWTTGAAQLQPAYDSIPADLEYPRAVIDPAATVTVTFDAGGGFTLAQNVRVALDWEGHAAAVGLGGGMTGSYRSDGDGAASGSGISLEAQDNTLTVAPLDEQTGSVLFAAATQETLAQWPVSASGYTCDDTTLVLNLETEGFPASLGFTRG